MFDEVEVAEGKRSSAAWRLLTVGREVLPALRKPMPRSECDLTRQERLAETDDE